MKGVQNDEAATFLYFWRISAPMTAPTPEAEYNFDHHLSRRHRFDFAWPFRKVAVEVNGNAWGARGGGRHGKDSDLEKLNLAASLGWRVFQFSPRMLRENPDRCIEMVVKALERSV